jgi:hypothetical protein
MLISEEVMIGLNGSNVEYYKALGYKIIKSEDKWGRLRIPQGTKIKVKVQDLPKYSNALVKVECDCENCITPIINPISWFNYIKCVKDDGKYYCKSCSNKLFGVHKRNKINLLKSKSFEQWCLEHNRQDILERWDYELNKCLPSEIGYTSTGFDKNGYWFKCLKHPEHGSELKSISYFTSRKGRDLDCNKCNSFAQYLIDLYGENALELYWDYEKNINISPWEISYGSSTVEIFLKCQEKEYHGSYSTICKSFSSMNCRCPYCNNTHGKVHPLDSLGELFLEVINIWSDVNEKTPYEYSPNSGQEVYWKCECGKHEDYKRSIGSSSISNFRCPECVQEREESFLQEKVRIYLESLNDGGYTILHEHKCTIVPKNTRTKQNLPFDNEIKELKLIIEVHGAQHYKTNSWHKDSAKLHNTTPEQELHYQKLKDRYKRICAKSKGYEYLEIPYWTDNKDEDWKKLINNKINEILIKEGDYYCQD